MGYFGKIWAFKSLIKTKLIWVKKLVLAPIACRLWGELLLLPESELPQLWSGDDLYPPGRVEVKFRHDEEVKHIAQYLVVGVQGRELFLLLRVLFLLLLISFSSEISSLKKAFSQATSLPFPFQSYPVPSHPLHSSSGFILFCFIFCILFSICDQL